MPLKTRRSLLLRPQLPRVPLTRRNPKRAPLPPTRLKPKPLPRRKPTELPRRPRREEARSASRRVVSPNTSPSRTGGSRTSTRSTRSRANTISRVSGASLHGRPLFAMMRSFRRVCLTHVRSALTVPMEPFAKTTLRAASVAMRGLTR